MQDCLYLTGTSQKHFMLEFNRLILESRVGTEMDYTVLASANPREEVAVTIYYRMETGTLSTGPQSRVEPSCWSKILSPGRRSRTGDVSIWRKLGRIRWGNSGYSKISGGSSWQNYFHLRQDIQGGGWEIRPNGSDRGRVQTHTEVSPPGCADSWLGLGETCLIYEFLRSFCGYYTSWRSCTRFGGPWRRRKSGCLLADQVHWSQRSLK